MNRYLPIGKSSKGRTFIRPARVVCHTFSGLSLLFAATSFAETINGDALRGNQLYEQRCAGCHSIESNRIGPAHAGVFGRKIGGVQGYSYSTALSKQTNAWDAERLDAWLRDPEKFIPGQKMGYRVDNPQDRADLIAYLRKISQR